MATKNRALQALGLAVGAFAAIMVVSLCFVPQDTYAGVGPGDSASGGGGACPRPATGGINGCPFTTNGQGWFEIPVDASNAPTGNSFWGSANATCKSEGATHVIAYVVFTGEQQLRYGWIYAFIWNWASGGPYIGNLSVSAAQARFNALPASERIGYTFGSNLGWFCYNSNPPWSITARSYIRKAPSTTYLQSNITSARPTETIQWQHTLTANGRINRNISYNIRGSGLPSSFKSASVSSPLIIRGSVAPAISSGTRFVYFSANTGVGANRSYMTYTVRDADVGNNLCQRIEYSPSTNTSSGTSTSPYRCVNIPYSYTLTPTIVGMTDNAIVENASGTLPVLGRVTNSGDTKSHNNIEWQLTQAIYDPGDAIGNRGGGVDARNPCAYFTGSSSCGAVTNGSGVETSGYARSDSEDYSRDGTVGDYEVGTRVCYAMSVKRNSSSNTDWRHSRMFCRVVGKEPKVQVLGGDLVVGRATAYNDARSSSVITSRSQLLGGLYYGSWVEYGIIASGRVTDMASGAGYASGSATNVMCSLSYLTFTNGGSPACSNGNIGQYTHTSVTPNIASRFPISSETPRITSASVTLGGGTPMREVYTTDRTTLTINGGSDIVPGQWVVINAPDTDVTIANNITYTPSTLGDVTEIPQVIIIARNIYIADNVSNVDSWLVAVGSDDGGTQHGIVNTCGAGGVSASTLPNSGQCGTPLVINGPVLANHLYLHRTAGAGTGTNAGDPGEIINLRADAYVWASSYTPGTGRLPSVSTTELPPRF